MAVCAWAARQGYESVTLTTFRSVAFNMPFYESLGFDRTRVLHGYYGKGLDAFEMVRKG